jgi:hypothetical protein
MSIVVSIDTIWFFPSRFLVSNIEQKIQKHRFEQFFLFDSIQQISFNVALSLKQHQMQQNICKDVIMIMTVMMML